MSEHRVLTLSAYLIRQVAGLGDDETTVLDASPETVRELALRAVRESDTLRLERDQAIAVIGPTERKLVEAEAELARLNSVLTSIANREHTDGLCGCPVLARSNIRDEL